MAKKVKLTHIFFFLILDNISKSSFEEEKSISNSSIVTKILQIGLKSSKTTFKYNGPFPVLYRGF